MSDKASEATLDRAMAGAALCVYSLAVAFGFTRVFSESAFFSDMFVIVLVGHVTGFLLRRAQLVIAVVVQLLVIAWICAVVAYWDTFTLALPTSTTWDLLRADLSLAGDQFSQAVAPVVYAGGWTALAVIGMGVVVALSDIFAFRASARFEALVPGGVLFIIVGALGDGRDQVLTSVVLILTGVVALGTLRAMQQRPARVVIGRTRPQRAHLASTALALGVFTATASGIVGPNLPGAESEAIYDTSHGPPEVTRIESPLIDIRSRLTNQSTREMFSVTTETQSYWRTATLSEFDGTSWKLERAPLSGIDELTAPLAARTPITQEIVVGALRGQLVPAAPDPVDASGQDLRWSEHNTTLVLADDELKTGDTIVIESQSPRYTPAELDAATSANPPEGTRYLGLPDDLPSVVEDTALGLTRTMPNDYRKALALQNWFRDNFEYSLEVQQGHGNSAIESFLRLRVGYCEQFAGTFAAMARSVGLPTRVAVGFTPGTLDEATGTYKVAGRNSHAWPEVWFDGLGWVAFEPTPGRGMPGSQDYTGVPPQQETGEVTPPPPPLPGEPGATTTVPGSGPSRPQTSLDEVPNIGDRVPGDTVPVVATGGRGGPDVNQIAMPLLIGLAVLALIGVAPWIIRRLRARHLGADPEAAIVTIYERLRSLVTAAGAPTTASVTPREFARRAAATVPGVRQDLTKLTDAVTASAFGPTGQVDARLVAACERWYSSIESVAKTLLPWHVRLRRYLTLR